MMSGYEKKCPLCGQPVQGDDTMAKLRDALDSRGVEWRNYSSGYVKTRWFVPGWPDGGAGHFCTASVTKDHRDGPIHFSGYVTSIEAMLDAALGSPE